MKVRPILFNGEMVRAILDGRKTQTRRVIKKQEFMSNGGVYGVFADDSRVSFHGRDISSFEAIGLWKDELEKHDRVARCPYGAAGDHLWVRETWQRCFECGGINYRATANENGRVCQHCDNFLGKWKPSIHMFRDDSRILLEVTAVRVERVQSITDADARAEGVGAWHDTTNGTVYKPEFAMLWDSINAKRGYSWGSNPFVWVVEFKMVQP